MLALFLRTVGLAVGLTLEFTAILSEEAANNGKLPTGTSSRVTFKKKIRHLEDKITLTPRCHRVIVLHKQ